MKQRPHGAPIGLRFYFSYFLLCMLSATASAQTNQIDSLKHALEHHKANDTTRINLLNQLAEIYSEKDITISLEYLEKSKRLADSLSYTIGKAKVLYLNGIIENNKTNLDQRIHYLEEALQLYKILKYKPGISKCYNGIGLILQKKGAYQNAIEYYLKSASEDEAMGNKKGVAGNYRTTGVAYFEIGDYTNARDYYEKALKISREIDDDHMSSRCLMNIGNIYLVQDQYHLALEFYNESLAISEQRKDTALISLSLNNMGLLYGNLEKYDKALQYSERALEIQKKLGDKKRIAETSNALGLFHTELKNYDEALKLYAQAYEAGKEIENEYINGFTLNNIGYVYLELNDYQKALSYYEEARKTNMGVSGKRGLAVSYYGLAKAHAMLKNYEPAIQNGLRSKELLAELKIKNIEKEIEELFSVIYQQTGNYQKALESHKRFKVLNDSLFNKENIEKIAKLESEYKYQQALDSANIRELELSKTVLTTSQDLAQSRQNYLWAVIGILIISSLLGTVVFYQKFNTIKVKNQNIITEQKLLRSQMTPHFIFNSLSVLQGMILNKEEKKSITYLSKFSKLLRIVLENSRDKTVPLAQELDAIDHYMTLKNLDTDPSYDYRLEVDNNIDINLFLIPPMLIQPFIENAVEHAFTDGQDHREIKVRLIFEDKKLSCTITDNGIGIDAMSIKANTNKKSLATTITAERLQLLSKDFHGQSAITIEDRKKYQEQGTRVTLFIPYKIS